MSRPVKGLLIKDLRLIFSQMKLSFVILVVWGMFMANSVKEIFFVPGYVAVFCSFLSFSTFSYDEFDNGAAYIFTLPIQRKDYVRAKYLLCVLLMVIPTIIMTFITYAANMGAGGETALLDYFIAALTAIAIAFLLMAVESPLYIKFGQEKGRIVTMLSVGVVAAGFGVIGSLCKETADGMSAVNSISGMDSWMLILLMAAGVAVLTGVSYRISCVILERKQY
ncbi:MAG: ABC-2 transporter permease [Lachnospiraceae bacterium]|nr:ABC-2 transporter permease [Lachnospiraceae bacterium]